MQNGYWFFPVAAFLKAAHKKVKFSCKHAEEVKKDLKRQKNTAYNLWLWKNKPPVANSVRNSTKSSLLPSGFLAYNKGIKQK